MFITKRQLISLIAIALLVGSLPLVWQIDDVRAEQASADRDAGPVANRVSVADYDGDGIPDSSDICPTRPETTNGVEDDDGCPEVVATTGAS